MNQTTNTANIDLAQLDSLQRYADSCVPTALPSEKLGALIALARRSLTSGAPAESIYQAQFEGEYGSVVWHDVTEAAYHTFMPQYRRIVRIHDAAAPCDCCKDIREAETIHGDGPDAAAASAEQARNDTLEEVAKMLLNGRFLHDEAPPKLFANEAASAIREMKRAGAAAKSEQAPLAKEPDLRSVLKEIPLCYPWGTGRKLVREGTSRDWVSVRESTGSTQTLAPMNQNIVNSTIAAVLRAISSDAGSEHAGVSQQAGVHAGELADERALFEAHFSVQGWDGHFERYNIYDPQDVRSYKSRHVNDMWDGWQARAALSHQSPASGENAGKDERALPALPESLGFMDVFRKGGGTKSVDGYTADQMREYARAALSQAGESAAGTSGTFQAHVEPWMAACFGPRISADTSERNHRFFEEATELAQAGGMPKEDALMLVEYVYGRPVGELHQEVGGVMVTLAALCLANKLNMNQAGEVELARIWTKVEAIRSKQATKPKNSPLPQHAEKSAAPNVAGESAGAGEALDAARYRWLRDKSEPGICAFYLSVGQAFKDVKFERVTVDKVIDAQIAAMAAAQQDAQAGAEKGDV